MQSQILEIPGIEFKIKIKWMKLTMKKSASVPTSANLSTLNHFVSLAVANFVHPLIWMTASLEKHYSKGKSLDHIYSLEKEKNKSEVRPKRDFYQRRKHASFIKQNTRIMSVVHCGNPRKYNPWSKCLKASAWTQAPSF